MTYGYAGKILRLNLTTKTVSTIDTSQYEDWGGGNGMGAAIYWDLCADKSLASGMDPKNVVTIMGSPLSGTLVPSAASRCEMQGVGPQGYPIEWHTRSNFGGRWAGQLKQAGWDGVVIEGAASSPVWINIINDQVTIEDASTLWGLNTTETTTNIQEMVTGYVRVGDWVAQGNSYTTQKPSVLCIGQAGEHLSRLACVIHDLGHGAGQGGFGAVWGSKNLKAISVVGTGSVQVADPQALMDAWLWYKQNFAFNVDNPRRPEWADQTHDPYGDWCRPPAMATFGGITAGQSRGAACLACPRGCTVRSDSGRDNEGTCDETCWIGGVNNDEMATLCRLIGEYGINAYDPTAPNYLVALNQLGIVGPGKQVECNLPFDTAGALTQTFMEPYFRQVAYAEGIGKDLADGIARASVKWGRWQQDSSSGLLQLPEWGWPPHDIWLEVEWPYGSILGDRDINEHCFAMHGALRTLTPMISSGAGFPLTAEEFVGLYAQKVPPYNGDPFMFDYGDGPTGIYSDHRAKEIAWHRHYTRFWKQSVLYCDWVWPDFNDPNVADYSGATPDGEPKFFNAVTGKNLSFTDGVEIGRKIWNLERSIWVLQGRHRDMEIFPDWMYDTPISTPFYTPVYENGQWKYSDNMGRKLNRTNFEAWKTLFFKFEGWDSNNGYPTRATLEGLGLGNVANTLDMAGKLGSPS